MKFAFIPRTFITVLLLTVSLVAMVGMKQYTLNSGKVILLKTIPIDPRSLFRGDYVRLNYAINTIETENITGDTDFAKHDRIYAVLEQAEKYWQVVSIHHAAPDLQTDQLLIKGKVKYTGTYRWDPETRESIKVKNISVNYGIENYFVPEGQGRILERLDTRDKVDMQIALDKRGNAAIKGVLVNGEQRYVETLF